MSQYHDPNEWEAAQRRILKEQEATTQRQRKAWQQARKQERETNIKVISAFVAIGAIIVIAAYALHIIFPQQETPLAPEAITPTNQAPNGALAATADAAIPTPTPINEFDSIPMRFWVGESAFSYEIPARYGEEECRSFNGIYDYAAIWWPEQKYGFSSFWFPIETSDGSCAAYGYLGFDLNDMANYKGYNMFATKNAAGEWMISQPVEAFIDLGQPVFDLYASPDQDATKFVFYDARTDEAIEVIYSPYTNLAAISRRETMETDLAYINQTYDDCGWANNIQIARSVIDRIPTDAELSFDVWTDMSNGNCQAGFFTLFVLGPITGRENGVDVYEYSYTYTFFVDQSGNLTQPVRFEGTPYPYLLRFQPSTNRFSAQLYTYTGLVKHVIVENGLVTEDMDEQSDLSWDDFDYLTAAQKRIPEIDFLALASQFPGASGFQIVEQLLALDDTTSALVIYASTHEYPDGGNIVLFKIGNLITDPVFLPISASYLDLYSTPEGIRGCYASGVSNSGDLNWTTVNFSVLGTSLTYTLSEDGCPWRTNN